MDPTTTNKRPAIASGFAQIALCLIIVSLTDLSVTLADDQTKEETAARELYDKMVQTIRSAKTLSFSSQYQRRAEGLFDTRCSYHVWLKKPNLFRMESRSADDEQGGILVGDGRDLSIHWPNGRPKWKYVTELPEDENQRFDTYINRRIPKQGVSLWHDARLLGYGMSFPILQPSDFFGWGDPIDSHIDSVRSLGEGPVGEESCTTIEVSLFDHQRVWQLSLSKRDHLPRRLKEVVHIKYDVITDETWSSVLLNQEIPDSRFSWKPPAEWREWSLPGDNEGLLKPGTRAPDFELSSINGDRIKRSDFNGKAMLLCFWRVGCPPCRVEFPCLQTLYTRLKDKGFIVLGVNVADEKDIVDDFLRKNPVTFPMILDNSEAAFQVPHDLYGSDAVPMTYLIDADGIIVDAWIGFDAKNPRIQTAISKLDPKLGEAMSNE